MAREELVFPWLREFTQRLGLQWKITVACDLERDAWFMRSNKKPKLHEIYVASHDRGDLEAVLTDITRHLCMAKYAETLDPLFSTFLYSNTYNSRRDQNFIDSRLAMYLALTPRFVWADDLRHQLWPHITTRDQRRFAKKIRSFLERNDRNTLQQLSILLTLARYKAQCSRYTLESHEGKTFTEIGDTLSGGRKSILNLFTDKFTKLPRLPNEKENALRALEQYAVEFGYYIEKLLPGKPDIHPRICREEMYVWRF